MRWLLPVALCGCTQLYDLDATTAAAPMPPPPDLDGDGKPDLVDNCPGVANPMQDDRDQDGFGDACDLCPDLASLSNHDEDADAHGDACDLCPVLPDFLGEDQDQDRVGDACDNDFASPNTRLLFDSFETLGTPWTQIGMWSLLGDSVAPVEQGAMLYAQMPEITGGMNDSFEVLLGMTLTAPLKEPDQLEVQLVDDTGAVVVGCRIQCTSMFNCVLADLSGLSAQQVDADRPLDELAFRRNPFGQYCVYNGGTTSIPTIPFARGSVRLVGTPKVQFRYITITQ
jgi:hypothetical protein